ncbi:protein kinase domain-containing protein [Pendulispora rubella]|uniref:protein kinase domain-containing protein n=1 Tax=Pendulispora rubella TaxID=2741070 RepID=UPI00374E1ACB
MKLLPASASTAPRIARFEDEIQHTARLSHPNTVTIFDCGRTPEGIFYYAMELLDGGTVQDTIDATGPMPPERVAKILMHIAGALDEAQSIGVVHRDVKPSNVVLYNQGGSSISSRCSTSVWPNRSSAKENRVRPIAASSEPRSTSRPRRC